MRRSKNVFTILLSIPVLLVLLLQCSSEPTYYRIYASSDDPRIQFAIEEIGDALSEIGIGLKLSVDENADIVLQVRSEDTIIKSEGFRLTIYQGMIRIEGVDGGGVMYGGMELAEQIRISGMNGVVPTFQNPYMERRGTKFNIPLDLRTPSYTDVSDVAQKNIPEMWNFDFWKEYIDNLARYRYNYISLWNLHPFPSLVKVPGYEDVALNDVQRSTVKWKENYSTNGTGFCTPEILANPETVLKISIDEKIEFWRKVMRYAKDRNIDFYVITWNIFVHGAEGKYGISDDINNLVTRDYFRKSVKQMFITYPDLGGVGLTTGENMHGASTEEKEDWAFETYAQGVMDAADEMPGRKFTFIHRQHQTGAQQIAEKFKPLIENKNIDFIFSFKYAKAHVMSAETQPYHEGFVDDIGEMKTIWTLRNDDNYYFRWGAPDFVRDFVKNIPIAVSRGYYYGSDQWVWGREFTMKNPEGERQIEIVKHWYHWMMWGRLGYDPDMTNDRFALILQNHFPGCDGKKLLKAWQEASMIYPATTGFHWGPLDFQWYIEGCKSRPGYAKNETGFHDVNRFISLPPHPRSGFQSIPDYVDMTISGGISELLSPLEVSQQLHKRSDTALEIVGSMDSRSDMELKYTLHDIETMALLGKYYAFKIAGSTRLALFRASNDQHQQDLAIENLSWALDFWKQYTTAAMQQNINPIWTNRVGYVDWVKTIDWVKEDIEIARNN